MNPDSKRDWRGRAAGRACGPRRLAVRRRVARGAWPAVIAAATLSLWSATVAVAQRPEVTENSIGMRLVKIPAGEFEMGSEDTSETLRAGGFLFADDPAINWDARFAAERPVHRVQITRAFLLGATEVTQAQWRKVMDSSPWKGETDLKDSPDAPATFVSWDDAVEYCARLTKLEQSSGNLRANQRYRLPTEAEWEYACRAGTKTRFWFRADQERLDDYAWLGRSFYGSVEIAEHAQDVGQKKPNPWGLHDMHGNVWEWCSDWYDEDYYWKSPVADPEGPNAGSFRVLRGGARVSPVLARSAFRFYLGPKRLGYLIGFRVVCELE